jgi:ribosomal protein L17
VKSEKKREQKEERLEKERKITQQQMAAVLEKNITDSIKKSEKNTAQLIEKLITDSVRKELKNHCKMVRDDKGQRNLGCAFEGSAPSTVSVASRSTKSRTRKETPEQKERRLLEVR